MTNRNRSIEMIFFSMLFFGVTMLAGTEGKKDFAENSNKWQMKLPVEKKRVNPFFPRAAKIYGYEGTVILKALIDTTGRVKQVELLNGAHQILENAAIQAARKFEYIPAEKGNRKVEAWVSMPFNFQFRNQNGPTKQNCWLDENLELGRAANAAGEYENAIEMYKKGIANNPDCGYATRDLGLIYSKLGRDADALNMFLNTLDIYPRFVDVYNKMAEIYIKHQAYEDATFAYETVIKINNKQAFGFQNLGYIYALTNRYKDAADAYKKALKISSDFAFAHSGLIVSYELAGKKKEREKAIRKAIETCDRIYEFIGDDYLRLGQYEKAIENYEKAILYKPEQFQSYSNWGWSKYQLGDLEEAIRISGKTAESNPEYYNSRYNIAFLYLQLGNVEKAKTIYQDTWNFASVDRGYFPKSAKVDDLVGLINQGIMVQEATEILNDVFNVRL